MSRATPEPVVIITSNIITDDETGVNSAAILIDIAVGDSSSGFVCLDEPGDLYILRNTIDDYIRINNIKESIPMNTEAPHTDEPAHKLEPVKPKFLGVIEGYINSQYHPTRSFNPDDRRHFRVMTSQEIILELADMVDMELNDVAEAMLYLGYRTIIHDGKAGWLLELRTT